LTQQFITLLADHKGNTRPKVSGDEYFVDCFVKMTVYHTADVINASDVGLSTITAATITGTTGGVTDGSMASGAYIQVPTANIATGLYTSSSSIKIVLFDNDGDCTVLSNATNMDDLTFRLRIWGNL
jgi:GTPase